MKRKTKVDYDIVYDLLNKGYNYTEIGKIMGVKPVTINCYVLKRKGKLITGNKPIKLTQKQKEVVFGSLLGDMYCGKLKNSKNPSFKIEHSIKQLNYLKYKLNILSNLLTDSEIKIYNRLDKRFKNPNYKSCYIQSKANPELFYFYNLFYKNKVKRIPEDLTLLTPLAIAIWFMDDGLKLECGYGISTNSFSLEDVTRICQYLKNTYGLEYSITKKNTIYIKANSRKKFTNLIKKYIDSSMLYKLHKN